MIAYRVFRPTSPSCLEPALPTQTTLQGSKDYERAVVVDAEKKENKTGRKRKTLSGEKKEVCSKRV
jgi:hypothetical protein